MVGYWPFNGNSSDYSGNGNDAVMVNTSNFQNGYLNEGVFIEGENALYYSNGGYVEFPNIGASFNNEFTFTFWVNLDTILYDGWGWGGERYLAIGNGNTQSNELSMYILPPCNNTFSFRCGTNTEKLNIRFDSLMSYDNWHLISMTGVNNVCSTYIDGSYVGSFTGNTNLSQFDFSKFYFGRHYWGSNNSTRFKGMFDEFGVWNRALSEEEIQAIYNNSSCTDTVSVTIYDTTTVLDTNIVTVNDTNVIYDTTTVLDTNITNCLSKVNLALNGTYDANTYSENASNAFDDIDSTGSWSSRTYTGWISVVFDELASVDSLDFYYSATPGNTTTQEIYTTTDGTNWNLYETISLSLNSTTNGPEKITHIFDTKIDSSLGIKVNTTQNSSWVSWTEIRVWGKNLNVSAQTYDTINVYDTLITEIYDTITIKDTNRIYDSVTIEVIHDIYDTAIVNDTVVYDIYDTITSVLYHIDTTIHNIYDTTYYYDSVTIEVIHDIYDTAIVNDTVVYDVYDTITSVLYHIDTTTHDIYDTTYYYDSITVEVINDIYDTAIINDTIIHNVYDTLTVEYFDTNTYNLTIYDTTYVSVEDTLIIKMGVTTSSGLDNSLFNQVNIYPNPANELLNIEMNVPGDYQVILNNSNGQIVSLQNNIVDNIQIDISSYSSGLYYITIKDNQNMFIEEQRKIIIE